MSVKNLHSLINGRWFIHEQYGKALLPSLFPILEGRNVNIKADDREPESFIATSKGIVAAASFDGGNNQDKYVAIVNLKDPIYKYDQECGPRGTKTKMRILESFKNDPNCAGIVLDIDSGGGQVSGTPEFHDYLKEFEKPIVAYTDGYMCSAAYYIGSATNHIVANKRAEHIGSIGVMIHFIDVTGMYEQKGAKVITEYATQSTEKNRAFEELLKGNPELYIKNELDPIAESFIADIKSVRADVAEEAFAGGTWNASGALERHLVDELGTLQTAINKVLEISSKSKTTNTMSKQLPKLQAVLNLDAPLASLEDKGSYLNSEQLDAVEARIETLDAENAKLTQDMADLQTELNGKVEAAKDTLTATETSVDAMLTASGLEVTGTLSEKMTALSGHLEKVNKNDGAAHTTVRTDADNTAKNSFIDANASHNQLANSLKS